MAKLIMIYSRDKAMTRQQFLDFGPESYLEEKGILRSFDQNLCNTVHSLIYTREGGLSLSESHSVSLTGKDCITEFWFETGMEQIEAAVCVKNVPGIENSLSMVVEKVTALEQDGFEGREKLFLFFRLKDSLDIKYLKILWQDVRQGFLQTLSGLGIGKVVENYAVSETGGGTEGTFQFAIEMYCAQLEEAVHIAQSGELRFALLACRQWFSEVVIYLARELEQSWEEEE